MKSSKPLVYWRLLLTTVVIIVIGTTFAGAVPSSSDTITVVASVLPQRSIIVNDDLTIQQIYSNTAKDVRPEVYLNKLDGEQIAYTDSITRQYQTLKNSLDFIEPGLVYERPPSGLGGTVHNVISFLKHLLRL